MDAKKALSIFGSTSDTQKKSSHSKEKRISKDAFNYKALNESLLKKITQLKGQLIQAEKCSDRLREENQELRIRNQKLCEATDEEKIEIIVSQKIKNKLAHINAINQRTVKFLQNAGADMADALKDIEPEEKPLKIKKEKRKLLVEPNLEKVDESPIKRSTDNCEEADNSVPEVCPFDEDNDTPKAAFHNRKSRRSALYSSKENDIVEQETSNIYQELRRAPLLISPTTETQVFKKLDHLTVRKNKSGEASFIPSTPVQIEPMAELTTTGRRQRSAKLKVVSYKEIPISIKMRRPGKYDEPSPHIDNYLYK